MPSITNKVHDPHLLGYIPIRGVVRVGRADVLRCSECGIFLHGYRYTERRKLGRNLAIGTRSYQVRKLQPKETDKMEGT